MKLSTRAINNLVIFAMLAMIMLFNMDKWLPKPPSAAATRLIAEHDMLLRVDIGTHSLQRVGTDWRIRGGQYTDADAARIVERWHAARLTPAAELADFSASVNASIWLAGYAEPVTIELFNVPKASHPSSAWVRIANSVYRVDNVDYEALVF
ncbi:hypothetical protein [Alteromonas oceanisediminis]|uniref:hypothetical protein n=1 Tax=Alteromonas oceanisediminis TaxID=2836180 RepID=UPI001BDA20FC|nr:hypothetical protein [Alteromonas oceanisediminis]MBT0586748.1 hypothetical protein [Alteromonas oceanisediminis]